MLSLSIGKARMTLIFESLKIRLPYGNLSPCFSIMASQQKITAWFLSISDKARVGGWINHMATKTKQKNAVQSVKVEVAASMTSLDSLFGNRNALGYVKANASIADLSVSDVGSWIESKIDSSRAALSTAVLAFHAYARVATAENVEKLKSRLEGSRTCGKDIVSLGRAMASFEEKGLVIANVRDIYGLRDVRALALGNHAEASEKAIALLNEGASPRKVKSEVSEAFPEAKKDRKSPEKPAEKPVENSAPVIRRKETQAAFDALVKSFDQVAKWPKDVQDAAAAALAKVIASSRN